MTKISAAGNVEIPAYLVLVDKGFDVSCDDHVWTATKDQLAFSADGPIELLGVVAIYESRAEFWQATDEEIDRFLKIFPQE